MLHLTRGNLLDADAEALVNTVNTVGVMGKGIALMVKEAFPESYRAYREACERGEVTVGSILVTELPPKVTGGPRWILHFPTKQHWRGRSRVEWIRAGLEDLRRVILDRAIRSVAVPPLGCGNGGLRWSEVRPLIEEYLGDLEGVEVQLYEPTARYQNVVKRHGVEKLTPARALVAELIRRYSALGIECSLLEVQKLAYFLSRSLRALGLDDPLRLDFTANRYGPYADPLRHLLDALDGSYLHCDKRISDATPRDAIHFDHSRKPLVEAYLHSEATTYLPALRRTSEVVEGFESPLGMELLATVDWLLTHEHREPTLQALRQGLDSWPDNAGDRKQRLFDDRMLGLALERLTDPVFGK